MTNIPTYRHPIQSLVVHPGLGLGHGDALGRPGSGGGGGWDGGGGRHRGCGSFPTICIYCQDSSNRICTRIMKNQERRVNLTIQHNNKNTYNHGSDKFKFTNYEDLCIIVTDTLKVNAFFGTVGNFLEKEFCYPHPPPTSKVCKNEKDIGS